MGIHDVVAELDEGSFLDGLSEDVGDHVVGLDEARHEDEKEDGALEHLGASLVVAGARGSAVLLHGSEVCLVVSKHSGGAGDASTVVGDEVAHEDGSLGGTRANGGLGFVGALRNDLEDVRAPIYGPVAIHDDVPTHGVRTSAPRAIVRGVEAGGLDEVGRVRGEAKRDLKPPSECDSHELGRDEVADDVEAEGVVFGAGRHGEATKLGDGEGNVDARHARGPHELAHELKELVAVDNGVADGGLEVVETLAGVLVGAVGRVVELELALVVLGELVDVAMLTDRERALAAVARDLHAGELEDGPGGRSAAVLVWCTRGWDHNVTFGTLKH